MKTAEDYYSDFRFHEIIPSLDAGKKRIICEAMEAYAAQFNPNFANSELLSWRDIKDHPRNNSKWFIGLTADDKIVKAHYACNLSGEEQPAFEGFFINDGSDGFREIDLIKWMPLPINK